MIAWLILVAVQMFLLWIAFDLGRDCEYERNYRETHPSDPQEAK